MGDVAEFVGVVFAAIFGLALLAIYVATIIWAYGDATARGKSGCLVALVVAFLSWPIGLIVWLVFRPNGRH